ncbi:hypothetical protein [Comamonas testosteroni]|nr:hypothetical protein [Comamonas testosteroni]
MNSAKVWNTVVDARTTGGLTDFVATLDSRPRWARAVSNCQI